MAETTKEMSTIKQVLRYSLEGTSNKETHDTTQQYVKQHSLTKSNFAETYTTPIFATS